LHCVGETRMDLNYFSKTAKTGCDVLESQPYLIV